MISHSGPKSIKQVIPNSHQLAHGQSPPSVHLFSLSLSLCVCVFVYMFFPATQPPPRWPSLRSRPAPRSPSRASGGIPTGPPVGHSTVHTPSHPPDFVRGRMLWPVSLFRVCACVCAYVRVCAWCLFAFVLCMIVMLCIFLLCFIIFFGLPPTACTPGTACARRNRSWKLACVSVPKIDFFFPSFSFFSTCVCLCAFVCLVAVVFVSHQSLLDLVCMFRCVRILINPMLHMFYVFGRFSLFFCLLSFFSTCFFV